MDRVHEANDLKCDIPLPEPCRNACQTVQIIICRQITLYWVMTLRID